VQTSNPETAMTVERRGVVNIGEETVREMLKVNISPVSSRPEITVRRIQTVVSIIEI